ncbi:hypothetical protein [Bacillus wiedmannii]|uniref:hypothetical protein n=1 Tax=Bacillus wiedmannii TaxID=1890302 RepID=UPI0015CF14B0|nr:hypothetical protein [Bacillus wiedmannii]
MQGSVNDAATKAAAAEKIANEAKIKADTANNTSDSVQKQLDTIVINGDSSVEAAQARVDTDGKVHQVLKSRLDADYLKTIKVGNNQNRNLTADKPFLEIASVGGAAALHLTNGEGFTGPYILGIGKDAPGKGLELPNKANGNMITGTQRASVTDPKTYWMQVTQASTTSPLVRLEQNVSNAAPALQLLAFGTPTADQHLFYVGDKSGEAGKIFSEDGRIRWRRNIEIQDKDGSTVSKLKFFSQDGIPENQRHNFFIDKQGAEWYNYSGSAGVWFPFSIKASGGILNISAGGATNTVGTLTVTPIISIKNNMIGFFGATPVTKRTGVAVTPEAIHAALVSLGLISA